MRNQAGYLVRYGLMGHVGRFPAAPGMDVSLERGQAVVIKTERGLELGEILLLERRETGDPEKVQPEIRENDSQERLSGETVSDGPRVLRPASPADLAGARHAEQLRSSRFTLCRRIVEEGDWPLELIDVEPLLDTNTTVLHYLGPPHLELALLRARFRGVCDFDVVLEPVGADAREGASAALSGLEHEGRGGCGDCDCSGGGGGDRTTASGDRERLPQSGSESVASSCAESSHSGCSSCGIARWRETAHASGNGGPGGARHP